MFNFARRAAAKVAGLPSAFFCFSCSSWISKFFHVVYCSSSIWKSTRSLLSSCFDLSRNSFATQGLMSKVGYIFAGFPPDLGRAAFSGSDFGSMGFR